MLKARKSRPKTSRRAPTVGWRIRFLAIVATTEMRMATRNVRAGKMGKLPLI
jgi:hypothetical protein